MDSTLRALNGFGLGARVGERQRIEDPRGWLRAQLEGGPPIIPAPADASAVAIADAVHAFRGAGQTTRREREEARRRLLAIAGAESRAALAERAASDRPFVERLVAFWSNHLCVSTGGKLLVAPLAGSYEREAIRPHVLGRFEDLVLASARHPAMLIYLDNFQSIGPTSRGAQLGRGAPRGLNENYARELLELHTLGVNGGYTQQDVQQLAKMLTGWTVDGLARGGKAARNRRKAAAGQVEVQGGPGQSIGFAFHELVHEPGPKTLIGVRYSGADVGEGERAIRALCRHPSTSRFIAAKLVAHFVSDEPAEGAVDAIALTFRNSGGDLRAVARALVDLPDPWRDSARKFRTPQDWLVAVLRALDTGGVDGTAMAVLRQLRHPLWAPQAPAGFGDKVQEWADPDSLLNRAELARTIARRVRSPQRDPRALVDVVDLPAGDPLPRLLRDNSIPADERIALALAGPAFQWR